MSADQDPNGVGRRDVRLAIQVTDAELVAIDDYRFANHLPSRSEAVRQLLMTGMSGGDEQPDRRM
jgi:hypothetical protein